MPRRSILSPAERDSLCSFPEGHDEIIRHYTFNEAELSLIGQHRGAANRLGFRLGATTSVSGGFNAARNRPA